jgi:SulP family sulfate permease
VVRAVLERGGAIAEIGAGNVFPTKEQAIAAIYPKLDAAKCAACAARIFSECQITLPDGSARDRPRPELTLEPRGQ